MRPARPAWWFWIWGVAYILLVGVVVWSLMSARRWALSELASPASIRDWQSWREDVREEVRGERQHPGPVARRVPKSTEPPMPVLLRDHFVVMLGGALLFSSVLFMVFAWFVTGALTDQIERADPSTLSGDQ